MFWFSAFFREDTISRILFILFSHVVFRRIQLICACEPLYYLGAFTRPRSFENRCLPTYIPARRVTAQFPSVSFTVINIVKMIGKFRIRREKSPFSFRLLSRDRGNNFPRYRFDDIMSLCVARGTRERCALCRCPLDSPPRVDDHGQRGIVEK